MHKLFLLILIFLEVANSENTYYKNPFDFTSSYLQPVSISHKHPIQAKIIENTEINNSTIIINILQFGAVADGVTDNTIIFKAAFQKYKKIYIPEGKYLISKAINIPDSVELISGKGTLIGTGDYGIFRQTKSISNLIIDGITFNYQPPKDTIFGALYFDGGTYQNITIKNCTFNGAKVKTNGILLVAKKPSIIDGFTIRDNHFIDIQRAAIEILHRTKNKDDINTIINVIIDHNNFSYTNFITYNGGFHVAISLSDRINGTIIRNNYINGYRWGIETSKTINTLITDNTIYNANDAINSNSNTIKSEIINNKLQSRNRLQFYGDQGTTIMYNEIEGTFYLLKTNQMIVQHNIMRSNTSKALVWIDNSTNTLLTDNYIELNTPKPWDAIRGYGIKTDKSNTIKDNKIYIKNAKVLHRNTDGASIIFGNNITLKKPIN